VCHSDFGLKGDQILLERDSRFVRFHAMQSILFFGVLSFLEWVFGHLPFFGTIGGALGVVMFIGWIVMMVKAHRGEYYKGNAFICLLHFYNFQYDIS
jgi:uncharacterized membrane protein